MSADRSLYQVLREYAAGDVYPCHMPGHKRNPAGGEMADFFGIDITEIEGFDNLHHATGILKEAQERANRLYGADETFFLVNGSTAGILAALMAAARPGEEILIARNCHRSVYHAALMQNLKVHYYRPRLIREYDICDGVSADEIGKLLDGCPEIKAVVITSPTYEGILSDVAGIATAVHERDKILIVDEAHGAHLAFCTETDDAAVALPEQSCNAIAAGADLVIHSLHKTLPSPTQTALLHVNGNRADRDRLRSYLAMVQSSSPSYILMAGMDACVCFLEKEGQERFAFFREQRNSFLKKTADLQHIRIGKMTDMSENGYAMAGWDMGKVLISVKDTDMTGNQLADALRKTYHIELEMAAAGYGLALMTLMDTAEGWQRLADALHKIDDRIEKEHSSRILSQCKPKTSDDSPQQEAADAEETGAAAAELPEAAMTLAQAFHSQHEEVMVREAAGRISADFINLYPPGIPLAAPGERLTQSLLDCIAENLRKGFAVRGVSPAGRISVVVEIPEKIWHY